ncbi:MAG: hypothetical protein SGPRY_003130, partial [Prymnesium sp.]
SISAGAKIMGGAAVAGGVAACLVTGSALLGVAAAGASAYAATRNDKVGEAAKATGQAANTVGSKVSEFNKEHKISERVVQGVQKGYKEVKAFDAKYDVSGKTAAGLLTGAYTTGFLLHFGGLS